MNPTVKEKWLAALRSGKYEQGEVALKCNNKFCCLGVLADIYAQENNLEWTKGMTSSREGNDYQMLDCGYYLPHEIVEWAELPGEDPSVTVADELLAGTEAECDNNGTGTSYTSLTILNDCAKLSFDKIAQVIEEKL